MLIKFKANNDKTLYIESTQVVALSESGTEERPTTIIHHNGTDVYSVIPGHVDEIALVLGYHLPFEAPPVTEEMSIAELDLPVRLHNALGYQGIRTIGDLMKWSWNEVYDIRNVGQGMMLALDAALKEHNLRLRDTPFQN
ncbi:DNA binding protein [Microbacterium phage Morrill]|nr:DNA binding protein [Microbacterium phage Atraxi]UQT01709.1 DNA binding protein [Microbacterium phage Morrill]